MSLDTAEAIAEMFRTATRQELMTRIRHDHELERYTAIADETEALLRKEDQTWRHEYDQRQAEAQQAILREAHGNSFGAPSPMGIQEIPDKETLIRKADERIRQAHHQRLAAIKKDELKRYQALRQDLVNRDRRTGQAQSTFNRINPQSIQRSGPSR